MEKYIGIRQAVKDGYIKMKIGGLQILITPQVR